MEQTKPLSIQWNQIFALAFLNVAIVISWMAYHSFQPILIRRFHFEHLDKFVQFAQAAVMIITPLLAGWVADYYKEKKGSSFAVFAIGISIASMLFMSVAFCISDQTFVQLDLSWLLPMLIILWLISMNIFHSPANAIVESFARHPSLPLIMAVLAITRQLVHSSEPLIEKVTGSMGGSWTFVAGGIMLIVCGFFFGYATRNLQSHGHEEHVTENKFHLVILYGLLTGLCHSLLLHYFPSLLFDRLGTIHTIFEEHIYLSMLMWGAALAAIPLSFLVRSMGLLSSLLLALFFAFVFMIPIILVENYTITAVCGVGLALAYSLMSITAFPYVLQHISGRNAIFGTGVFFACFEFPEIILRFMH